MNRTLARQIIGMIREAERSAYERGIADGIASAADRDGRKVYTVEEAGALLGIARNTAYKAVKEGKFPTPVVQIGRKWLVLRAPLDRVLGKA